MKTRKNPARHPLARLKGQLIEKLAVEKHGGMPQFLDSIGLTTQAEYRRRNNIMSSVNGTIQFGDSLFAELLAHLQVKPEQLEIQVKS
ncbi:hypothetical protein [Deinococcus roseus]|uniref:Uncharacterized protein n=1 Tax=Deinococcus roseus TaxID=392414 RepID=A0ABQ2D3Z7_9DEIO|nr:hypothetical protein [Deinococcus roseus]GGJ44549.1 hypothetical protein GCM10008938_33430 [Deinococcus roseus]